MTDSIDTLIQQATTLRGQKLKISKLQSNLLVKLKALKQQVSTVQRASAEANLEFASLQTQLASVASSQAVANAALTALQPEVDSVYQGTLDAASSADASRQVVYALLQQVVHPDVTWNAGDSAFTLPVGQAGVYAAAASQITNLGNRLSALSAPSAPSSEEELNGTLIRTTSSQTGDPYTDGLLDAAYGWAPLTSSFTPGTEWIELALPGVVNVVGVVVQRGNGETQYVSAFKVQAYIESSWVDVNREGETDSVWTGPNDQSTDDERIEARFPVSQNLITAKVRVLPWTWIGFPVLRVGLITTLAPAVELFDSSSGELRLNFVIDNSTDTVYAVGTPTADITHDTQTRALVLPATSSQIVKAPSQPHASFNHTWYVVLSLDQVGGNQYLWQHGDLSMRLYQNNSVLLQRAGDSDINTQINLSGSGPVYPPVNTPFVVTWYYGNDGLYVLINGSHVWSSPKAHSGTFTNEVGTEGKLMADGTSGRLYDLRIYSSKHNDVDINNTIQAISTDLGLDLSTQLAFA
jgi:hypothetical protein